jgi:23S rRNA pseudouridine2605 synthase
VRIKSRKTRSTILEMVLDEGRNREVRRLLARVGHKVQELRRVAVGPVRLGELPRGAVRPLSPKEVRDLQAAVESGPGKERAPKQATKRVNKPPATKRAKRPSARKNKDGRTVIG